ncbi:unnamed protein product, partial [Discosporangium mesarthrocarpum]
YDDSWLDEAFCLLFLVTAIGAMFRPFTEMVEFNAESGVMLIERWNLYSCGVFRYSCSLENISKLEITEAEVFTFSVQAHDHLRQGKEFGLRALFSCPCPVEPPATAPESRGGNGYHQGLGARGRHHPPPSSPSSSTTAAAAVVTLSSPPPRGLGWGLGRLRWCSGGRG